MRNSHLAVFTFALITAALAMAGEPPTGSRSSPPVEPLAIAPRLTDLYGDPLPEGAVMRLGTVRFRLPNLTGIGFRKSGELVAFSDERTLTVWPADGSAKPRVIAAGRQGYYGFSRALSADGRFAAGVQGRQIVVWKVAGDGLVEYLARDARDPRRSVFSPNGDWLAVNASGVSLCNLATKQWVDFKDPNYTDCLSFSWDGKWLAITTDRDVRVIDTAAGKERCRIVVARVQPQFAAVSPDGNTLAVLPMAWVHSPEPMVRLISIPSGEDVPDLKGPTGASAWVGFSPDGKMVLTGSTRGVREWDPAAGKVVREIPGPAVAPVAYSADGKRLASHGQNAVLFWDISKQRQVHPDLADAGHAEAVGAITISRDGNLIATHSRDGEIRIWAANTGRLVCRARATGDAGRQLEFFPDGKSFVTVTGWITPTIFDSTTGRELRRFTVPAEWARTHAINSLRLSSNANTVTASTRPVASGGKSYAVHWDVASGRVVERTEERGHQAEDFLSPPATSPDGRWFVQAGTLTRVGAKEGIELVAAADSHFMSATFSGDSRLVAAPRTPRSALMGGPPEGGLVIFDIGRKVQLGELPTGRVVHVAFSPDGRFVVVFSRTEIVVWELASAKPVRRYRTGHVNSQNEIAIALTPDGRRMITGHKDCTALVWDLTGTGRAGSANVPKLSVADLDQFWEKLGGDDAGQALTASWEVTDRPDQAVPFIRERVKPVKAVDDATVRVLVAKLEAKAFAEREKAAKGIRDLSDSAVPALRSALKSGLTAEQTGRVERLLAEMTAPVPPAGGRLRELRALAVLERAGTSEARALLKELAGGLEGARLTTEAAAALARIGPSRLAGD